jgi:hypothetical protein
MCISFPPSDLQHARPLWQAYRHCKLSHVVATAAGGRNGSLASPWRGLRLYSLLLQCRFRSLRHGDAPPSCNGWIGWKGGRRSRCALITGNGDEGKATAGLAINYEIERCLVRLHDLEFRWSMPTMGLTCVPHVSVLDLRGGRRV